MRNAQAFQLQFRIDRKVGPEIGVEQLAIFASQSLDRQRLAALHQGVDGLFKLGKHRLTDDRSANAVNHSVDQVGALQRFSAWSSDAGRGVAR